MLPTYYTAFESTTTSKGVTKLPSIMMTSTVTTSVTYSVTSIVTPSGISQILHSDTNILYKLNNYCHSQIIPFNNVKVVE